METKDVIQALIKEAGDQVAAYNRKISNYNYQIERLEDAYKSLGKIKDNFESTAKGTKIVFTEKSKWCGERYTSFCSAGDVLNSSCSAYYEQLDSAQDSINLKIAELRAKRTEMFKGLYDVTSKIEQWKAEFENATN